MNPYAQVDPVIAAHVQKMGSSLFMEWAEEPARFFYTPGEPPFEVFQIYVGKPSAKKIVVYARAIDTNDDTESEMEQQWEGQIDDLSVMLDTATSRVDEWKLRLRKKPDPPSRG